MRHIPRLILSGLLAMAAGCGRNPYRPVRASVRYLVFEAEPAVVDRAIGGRARYPLEASAYAMTTLSAEGMVSLSMALTAEPGALVDVTRVVEDWPRVADTWSYSRAGAALSGSGNGAGFLGVAANEGSLVIRVEYDVTHSLGTVKPFRSRLRYEGAVADREWLVFLAPFVRRDGASRVHVIALRVTPEA